MEKVLQSIFGGPVKYNLSLSKSRVMFFFSSCHNAVAISLSSIFVVVHTNMASSCCSGAKSRDAGEASTTEPVTVDCFSKAGTSPIPNDTVRSSPLAYSISYFVACYPK